MCIYTYYWQKCDWQMAGIFFPRYKYIYVKKDFSLLCMFVYVHIYKFGTRMNDFERLTSFVSPPLYIYMHISICLSLKMYMCIYIHIPFYIYVYVYTYIYIYTCIRYWWKNESFFIDWQILFSPLYIYTYVHLSFPLYIYIYWYAYIYRFTYIYISCESSAPCTLVMSRVCFSVM